MKKIISLIAILILLASTVACEKENNNIETTGAASTTVQNSGITLFTTTEIISNKEDALTESDNGGGFIESGKYRQCYYDVPYDFVILVGEKEFDRWYDEIYEFDPDKSQIVAFIQYFNISKEVFEKTNLQMAKSFAEFNPTMRPLDYENQQTYEIYNADIIYTFDDEIINEYYLTPDYPYCADFEYEAAIERGTYQTQTKDWVDIEAMEAEIIAKYGEAEIVTDAAEQTTSETAGEITTATETTLPEAQITPETDVRITE